MMRLALVMFLLVLCGGEGHSAESPTAQGECELQVAGTEADSAQAPPIAASLWGFVCVIIELSRVTPSGRRDVTRQARGPADEHSAVALRSPPHALT